MKTVNYKQVFGRQQDVLDILVDVSTLSAYSGWGRFTWASGALLP